MADSGRTTIAGPRHRVLLPAAVVNVFPVQHLIITGRDAPIAFIEYADLVTEMLEVKHPYQKGIQAQPGIEF